MTDSEFRKKTDERYEISLDSSIQNAYWGSEVICESEEIQLFVKTNFVGNGSNVDITVFDGLNKKISQLSGKVYGDVFCQTYKVSKLKDNYIYFEAKLPDHNLQKYSNMIRVIPSFSIKNMKWSRGKVSRGDILTLSAETHGIPDDAQVTIKIYEYDQYGAHDLITKFTAAVKKNKIEVQWEFEYHEDTDEIAIESEMQIYGKHYKSPRYFWTASYLGSVYGEKFETKLLEFKDFITICVEDLSGNTQANLKYKVLLANESMLEGQLDQEGKIELSDVVPGKTQISIIDDN